MQVTTSILATLAFAVVVYSKVRWSGLGFNIPNTRFCQPCIVNPQGIVRAGRSVSPEVLDAPDHECREYVHAISRSSSHTFGMQRSLLWKLEKTEDETAFIFFARLAAQIIFERIYAKPYTVIAIVEPVQVPNADFCILVHTGGDGFRNQKLNANHSELEEIKRGRSYEREYLLALSDYWVIKTCNETFHGIHLAESRKRFAHLQENALGYRNNDIFTGELPIAFDFPVTGEFPQCGSKPTYREVPTDPLSQSASFLSYQTPPRSRTTQPLSNLHPANSQRVPENSQQINAQLSNVGISPTNPRPNIFINEFYPCKSGSNTADQFIELRLHPLVKDRIMHDVKIIVLSMVTLRIVTVVNIDGLWFNEYGYFVVNGGDQIAHVSKDIDINNNLLPYSASEPFAILLLRKTNAVSKESWKAIKLKGRRTRQNEVSTKIDPPVSLGQENARSSLANVLKETVVDAYFYGRIINNPVSDTILSILPMYEGGCNFVLSVGNPREQNEDSMSLNLCPDGEPAHFMYQKFKLGIPTPWNANNCPHHHEWLYRIMEHNAPDSVGVTADPSFPAECPMIEELAHVIADINQELEFISKVYEEPYESPYYPVPMVSDFVLIKSLYNSEATREMISPFEHVPVDEKSLGSEGFVRVRCQICHMRLKLCPHSVRSGAKKDGLSQKEGIILPTNEFSAQFVLKRHLNRKQHHYSILNEIRHYKTTLAAERRTRFNREANEDEKHLAAAFLTSFTLFKTNTAIHNAKAWFRTLTLLNADVSEHWTSKTSVWNLMTFVSNEGLANIKRNMMEKQLPFSFLLDASSDRSNTHYVLFFVQTTEGEYSIVYFIGLIKLGKSATAEAYLHSIKAFLGESIP